MTKKIDFGGITAAEAGERLRDAIILMQEDPYYKLFVHPMMEERIRYDNSLIGKLIPFSPYERLKRKQLIMKIAFWLCIIGMICIFILLLRH